MIFFASTPTWSTSVPIRHSGVCEQRLDRWVIARTDKLVADAADGYEQYLTVNVLRAFEDYLDDLSNWYIRRPAGGSGTATWMLWARSGAR